MSKKLYKIKLRGLSPIYTAFAIGKTVDEVVSKFQNYLEKEKIGYASDRELESAVLLAENTQYPLCGVYLYE